MPLARRTISLIGRTSTVYFNALTRHSPRSHTAVRTLLSCTHGRTLQFFSIGVHRSCCSGRLVTDLLRRTGMFGVGSRRLSLVHRVFSLSRSRSATYHRLIRHCDLHCVVLATNDHCDSICAITSGSAVLAPGIRITSAIKTKSSFSKTFICSVLTNGSLHRTRRATIKATTFIYAGRNT